MADNIKIGKLSLTLSKIFLFILDPENNRAQDGSSFESASSMYSSTRCDNIADDLIVPSFSPPLEINDDFIVPDLSSPPLPLPERLPHKLSVEKIEIKAEITPYHEHVRRDREKTEIKPKEDSAKLGKVSDSNFYYTQYV